MGKRSVAITLTVRQREILEGFTRTTKATQELVERCRVVLLSAAGQYKDAQAASLAVDRQLVRRWWHRCAPGMEALGVAETAGATKADLEKRIVSLLTDGARSGAPAKFSTEQIVGLIVMACEPPTDSGLPVSHWTPSELVREAVRRGLVESISPRQVDRFLALRNCDRTRANTGSLRRTSEKRPNNIKPMSSDSATLTATRHSGPAPEQALWSVCVTVLGEAQTEREEANGYFLRDKRNFEVTPCVALSEHGVATYSTGSSISGRRDFLSD